MRVPRPAASTMARVGMVICESSVFAARSAAAHCASYQACSGASAGCASERLQIAPYARHVTQILRLAVAPVEPGEDAEDLGGALRRRASRRAARKPAASKSGSASSRACDVAAEQRDLQRLRHVDARVLQQRGEVVGAPGPSARPGNRAGRRARCPRARAARAGWASDSRAAPRSAARRARGCSASRHSAMNSARAASATVTPRSRQIPVEQQLGLDQERVDVVGRQAIARRPARPAASPAAGWRCSATSTSTAAS